MLAEVREKLRARRDTSALFDTARFTRHLEAAYQMMWERAQRGDPAQDFAVDAID
jgi:predicted O-linked N-acetylglucosamine transferase (SPINDLY family)